MLHEVKKESLGKGLESGTKLLVFYASWCGPCRMYKSSLEDVSSKDGVDVYRVNIDEDKAFATEMGVSSIPATFIYKDGQVVKHFAGYRPYEQLLSELK
ncbi:thioredoxin family protein [Mycoplasmopsis alligatoris]|uniref:Thioredoxin n=1 Tax=Mycoplasmopsis alligatoris A21JP2 TaxID=747682 RepID=D4XWM0_9BACT|nr:thioredoxin family protein [Mycoplasmopsis alligatoris]EFF41182.1 thioredoxin [Mycoplasmopsis alligatoris A21JP2]